MKGWVFSIVVGILSSGPIYVWYPLLPIMIYYFGFIHTLILTVYIILTSVIVGYLTELIVDDESKSN